MRGTEDGQPTMFSYVSQEDRIPEDHPLRALRKMVDPILEKLSNQFEKLYADWPNKRLQPTRLGPPLNRSVRRHYALKYRNKRSAPCAARSNERWQSEKHLHFIWI
jgi:hypothetical protein